MHLFMIVALLGLACTPPALCAQTEADMESLLESVAQDTEVSPQLDAVDYFAAHPLPLRSATARELLLIPGFSPTTARAIIKLARADTVLYYDQIASQLGLSGEQLQLLQLCTTLEPASDPLSLTWRARYRGRLNTLRGFAANSFAGSPLDMYQRISAALPYLEVSIATDKDAGERSLADFAGGYAQGKFGQTRVLLGDYSVQSGMGSVLGRPFGTRKGGDVLSPAVHHRTSVIPQRSAMEQNFFRGLALEHSFPLADSSALSMAIWLSKLRRAATVDSTSGIATSLDADGYFRTESEIARRGALGETAAGFLAEWQKGRLNAGVAILGLRYDKPVQSSSPTSFGGMQGALVSAHGAASFGTAAVCIETARDASGNTGVRAGVEHRAGTVQFALSFRSFPHGFRSPFGSSFGESPRPSNEQGFYIGCLWRPFSSLHLALYGDLYRTPGPTFTVPAPVRGLDLSAELRLALRHGEVRFRIRREDKTDAMNSDQARTMIFRNIRSSLRAEIAHDLSDSLRIRLRCEIAHRSFDGIKTPETGILHFLEVRYRVAKVFSAASRLAYYHTDSFDSAIWAYEQTVPGAMSSPAHYGAGMRWSATVQYHPAKALSVSFFMGITSKNNVATLGSGLMEIEGNTERQFSLQVDVVLK